jgi:hypothetical protein
VRRPDLIGLHRIPGRESLHNLCQRESVCPVLRMASFFSLVKGVLVLNF